MDIMKIKSRVLTKMLSKVIRKELLKNFGYDVDIQLSEISLSFEENGKAKLHLDMDAEMDHENITKILTSVGLG